MKKKIVKLLWKTLITVLFAGMIAYSLFFAYGLRFDSDSGGFIQTGVLDVSSVPATVVFIDDVFVGTTPTFLYGVPIKEVRVRLEKGGFYSWEKTLMVNKDMVVKIKNALLAPRNIDFRSAEIAPAEAVFVDHLGRGLTVFYQNLNVLYVIDFLTGSEKFVYLNQPLLAVKFDKNGDLLLANGETSVLFGGFQSAVLTPFAKNELAASADGRYTVLVRGTTVWRYDTESGASALIKDFSEKVDDAFWFPKSDSLVVVLKNTVHIIDYDGANEHLFSQKDADSSLLFAAKTQEFFWLQGNVWRRFSFDRVNEKAL